MFISTKYQSLNFTSKRQDGQSFTDFMKFNEQNHVEQILPEILSSDQFYLGEGLYNKVYQIPDCNDFVLKLRKEITPLNLKNYLMPIQKNPDIFPKINVGQPIARMGTNILILLKQKGNEYSIPFTKRTSIDNQLITKYLSDVEKLANIPQNGYNNFTDEVKELYSKDYYLDYFNSNNLMITNNEINTVDTIKINKQKQRIFLFPNKSSFIKMFADENVLPVIVDRLSTQEKQNLAKLLNIISDKTSRAMAHSDLPENNLLSRSIDFLLDNFWRGKNKVYYNAMRKLGL